MEKSQRHIGSKRARYSNTNRQEFKKKCVNVKIRHRLEEENKKKELDRPAQHETTPQPFVETHSNEIRSKGDSVRGHASYLSGKEKKVFGIYYYCYDCDYFFWDQSKGATGRQTSKEETGDYSESFTAFGRRVGNRGRAPCGKGADSQVLITHTVTPACRCRLFFALQQQRVRCCCCRFVVAVVGF